MERSYLPQIAGYIDRPRLDALYREALEYPMTTVVAGPGYGKTLSLARFMAGAPVRLVWVRILARRNTAVDFWESFVRAAHREMPEWAEQLDDLGFPSTPEGFGSFVKITTEEAEADRKLVFVFDGYENAANDTLHAFCDNLIDSELPNVAIFILCNAKLPFVEVLPVNGQYRITDADLAFTVEEAQAMFDHYGLAATSGELADAVRETAGWPLALRLMCASRQKSVKNLAGKSYLQMAAELFDQHYFLNYSPDIQRQLIRFSLLPHFPTEVLTDPDGRVDKALYDMLLLHPFVSYDYGSALFTMQKMYHDFLKLKQVLISPQERRDTCMAAGRWFLTHGMANEAMDCFWDASDYEGFLDAVAQMPRTRHRITLTNLVLQRLEQLPRSYADTDPHVDFSIAFMYLNAAEAEKARSLFLEVESRLQVSPDTPETRLLLGDIYATLADISRYMNDDTGLEWIKKAMELIPQGSRTHSTELMSVGNNSVFYLPNGEAGQLERMVDYYMEFCRYADKVMRGAGHGYEYLFAGEAAFYREEMDRAASLFNSAIMKAQQMNQHDILCNAFFGLMRIEFYFGNYKNAAAVLYEIENYINERNLVGLYELRDSASGWFNLRLGDTKNVPAWFSTLIGGPEEWPVALGRNRLIMAYYLFETGEHARASAVLSQMESLLGHRGRWHEKLWLYIMKAYYYYAAQEGERASEAFHRAYEMVYGNDIKVALAEFGREMMLLIEHVKKQDPDSYDIEWLDAVHRDAFSYAKRLQTMRRVHNKEAGNTIHPATALTKREDETLHYLAQGLTQQEIAKLMGISGNAVKKHVAKIYIKLGAVNRADAIHIASINGLVNLIDG